MVVDIMLGMMAGFMPDIVAQSDAQCSANIINKGIYII